MTQFSRERCYHVHLPEQDEKIILVNATQYILLRVIRCFARINSYFFSSLTYPVYTTGNVDTNLLHVREFHVLS